MLDSILQQSKSREPLPPLLAQNVWQPQLSREILAADLGKESEMTRAVRAGLLLWNDDLENAHPIVQAPETPINNFWHAILHRREGDFSNSHYWFRRVGTHPAFADIYNALKSIRPHFVGHPEFGRPFPALFKGEKWNPMEFVRLCENANAENDGVLRRIQVIETQTLLNWCRARIEKSND